jgi:hypothetical protein
MIVKFYKNRKLEHSKKSLHEYFKEIYENNKFFEIFRILKYKKNILNLQRWKKQYLKKLKNTKPSELLKKNPEVNTNNWYVYKKEKIFYFFKIILDFYDFSEKSYINYNFSGRLKLVKKTCNFVSCISENNRYLYVLNFRIHNCT